MILATLGILAGCEPNLQEPVSSSDATPPAPAERSSYVYVATPVSSVRDVEGQKLTLNFAGPTSSTLKGFKVRAFDSLTIIGLGTVAPTERSVTISLPDKMRSNYRNFGGMNMEVTPYGFSASDLVGSATFSNPIDRPYFLATGDGLFPNECMVSPNGAYRLCMRPDGNLVETNSSGAVIWQSNQAGRGASTLLLSRSGAFLTRNAAGTSTWSRTGRFITFLINDDGRLALKYISGLGIRTINL